MVAACLWAAPSPVRACSCAEESVDDAIARAQAIFEARVTAIEPGTETLAVTFAVTQAWRGVETETLVVHTPSRSAACGYSFEVGETYLVYATGTDALSVSLCSRTRPVVDADVDKRRLGSGTIPIEIVDEPIEPLRARAEPPARGGCASCAASGPGGRLGLASLLALVVALTRRRSSPSRPPDRMAPRAQEG